MILILFSNDAAIDSERMKDATKSIIKMQTFVRINSRNAPFGGAHFVDGWLIEAASHKFTITITGCDGGGSQPKLHSFTAMSTEIKFTYSLNRVFSFNFINIKHDTLTHTECECECRERIEQFEIPPK